jgi:hypothetical protein
MCGQTRDWYDGSRSPESQPLDYSHGDSQTGKGSRSPAENQCIDLEQIKVCLGKALIDHAKHPMRVNPWCRIAPATQVISVGDCDRAHVSSCFYR